MKGSKTRAILLLAFVFALGAGAVAGLLLSHLPFLAAASASPANGAVQSPLTDLLQLTPGQSDQMRTIWEDAQKKSQQVFTDAQGLQKGRDDALVAILTTDQQRAKYEKVTKEYAQRFAELNVRRDRMFQEAVEQTRRILSDEQKQKYEVFLRSRLGPRTPGAGKEILTSHVLLPDSETNNHR